MAILNNLYPPIVDTYAPAFLVDSASSSKNTCRIYFSISLYNSYSDIKNAQITICNQNTNASVLNEEKYPSDIMLTNIYEDRERESDDKYYIEIKKSDMINEIFEINQYYKVQIRFTSIDAENINISTPQAIDSWLAANQGYFSEWSTICLVRGISTPTISIPGFDTAADYTIWTTDLINVAGKVTFLNEEETETLKSYRILLYNDLDELISDSDLIYTNNYVNVNEINYVFKYAFQDGETYHMTIEYITNNLYSDSTTFTFMVILGTTGKMDATLTAVEDIENGRIGINIKSNTVDKFTGNLTIRRTSSENNFTQWEDIYTFSIENQILDITWYDTTIKSGVWYKYCAQKRDSLGNRGVITKLDEPVMIVFDHMYLNAENEQLNIKFNPQISSFKYVVSESVTTTIGSKYPFVKRNGYTYYRQFPISGLVSCLSDLDGLITTKEEIYQDTLELYNEYNEKNRITILNDYTYERNFREKVMEFLYKDNIKLFRSPTEGNILVKITDINFTPNQTLGRMLYTFSCTANEIADFTMENCNLYNIQSLGQIDSELAYVENFMGQFNEVVPAGTDVLNLLQEKYNKFMKEGFICSVDYLDFLRIEMEQEPYLIKEGADGPYPIDDIYPGVDEQPASAYLGYIVYINGEPIVINPEGIYELKGEGIKITSLVFPTDTQLNIQYHVSVSQTEDKSQLPRTIEYTKKVGQKWGAFEYKDSIFQAIWNKYYEKYSTYIQSLLSLDNIKIEAEPGTVVYVAESRETEFEKHIIGETCTLSFDDEDTTIIGLYFAGIHFEEATNCEKMRDLLSNYRYINTGITINSLDEVINPIKNGVYTLNKTNSNNLNNILNEENTIDKIQETKNKVYSSLLTKVYDNKFIEVLANDLTENQYIWYNDKWWLFTDSHDLLCPVEALIDYTCEISKGWYAI